MNLMTITQPNTKGQIVIPKNIRQELGITPRTSLQLIVRGHGLYVHPIEGVYIKQASENSYVDILQKTQGKWRNEQWSQLQSRRRKIERQQSKKQKLAW